MGIVVQAVMPGIVLTDMMTTFRGGHSGWVAGTRQTQLHVGYAVKLCPLIGSCIKDGSNDTATFCRWTWLMESEEE